jgi:4-diphosphocytidyl-2-C-methyl-D-erythritol kinase
MATLAGARNDLEPPAIRLAPGIAELRSALSVAGARLVRLSGSGATVFGLFPSAEAAQLAAMDIAARQPAWWVRAARLGG